MQYRAAKLVTGALHFSSREKLNIELGWESIQQRIEFLGLSLFQKIHLYETRPLIRKCMTNLDTEKKYYMRSKGAIPLIQIMAINFLILSSHITLNFGIIYNNLHKEKIYRNLNSNLRKI